MHYLCWLIVIRVALASTYTDSESGSYLSDLLDSQEVDAFIKWSEEEKLLDMYHDVIVGRRPADSPTFRPLSTRLYFTILSYQYKNLNETFVQSLLINSPVLPNLPLDTIQTQLRNQEIFTSIPTEYFRVIYDMRHSSVETIAKYLLGYIVKSGKSVNQVTIENIVRLWLDLCISAFDTTRDINESCFLDAENRKWRMTGDAKTIMFRFFALRDIPH